MQMGRRVLMVCAVLVASLVLTIGRLEAAPKGVVRVALVNFDRESTAPWMGSTPNVPYAGNMFDPLIAADGNGKLSRDGIITEWKANTAGDSVLLTVRPGVRFHNGDELTAEDIQFSIELAKNAKASPSLSAGGFKGMIRAVDIVSRHQLRINLTGPNAIFPHILSWVEGDAAVVPKAYFESLPGNTTEEKIDAFSRAPIGSGPWKFVKRNLGQDIEFEANLNYWDPRRIPQFARLRLVKVPEQATRMNMLRTGEVDLAEVDAEGARILHKEGLKIVVNKNVSHVTIQFNQCHDKRFLTNDVRFRKALTLAVDREAVASALWPPISPEIGSVGVLNVGSPTFGPGVIGYDPSLKPYPYDPNEARRLLKQTGYLDNPQTLVANSMHVGALPEAPKIIELVTAYWSAVGVQVKIRQVDWPFISRKLSVWPQGFDPPGEATAHSPWFRPSGIHNIRVFGTSPPGFTTEAERTAGIETGGVQAYHCDLNKIDRLYLDAVRITDPVKFEQAARNINRATYDDYWAIPLVTRSQIFAARPGRVASWTPVPLGPTYLRFETLVPGAEVK